MKVAIVSYHNTLPFIQAIARHDKASRIELVKATPAECITLFENREVELALVPAGALLGNDDYQIITNKCIATEGAVYSVAIFANKPLQHCTSLYLDAHSRSSNLLAQILLRRHYDVELNVQNIDALPDQLDNDGAYVLIGDKVFSNEQRFSYKYDLGQAWYDYCGLPFVFAVWVAQSDTQLDDIVYFEKMIGQLDLASIEDKQLTPSLTLNEYLTQYIKFDLTDSCIEGLKLYYSEAKQA